MASAPSVAQPVFYYDLGDPACYLVAEQISAELPVVAEWEPVATSRRSVLAAAERVAIERRAGELGLQPVRWPQPWPPDTGVALLAATYAKQIGRVVAFSLAAFRQAFAGGRDLGDSDTVLLAGAACEMHPTALLKAIGLRSVTRALQDAGRRAAGAGVGELPAVQVGAEVFTGARLLELAARTIG